MGMEMGMNGTKLQQFEFFPTFHALPVSHLKGYFLQSLWQPVNAMLHLQVDIESTKIQCKLVVNINKWVDIVAISNQPVNALLLMKRGGY